MNIFGEIRDYLLGNSPGAGTEPSDDHANDEAPGSPNAASLPAFPFVSSQSSLTVAAPTSIDLTNSPERPKERTQSVKLQRSSLLLRHPSTRSADEKRLTGDFATPSDCVFAPDPRYHFIHSQNHSVMPKPGAQNAFKPVNNIDDTISRPTVGKGRTYSKHGRTQPLIGKQKARGQQQYDELHGKGISSPMRSAHNKANNDIISLDDDDDVQEVSPHFVQPKLNEQDIHSEYSSQPARQRPTRGVAANKKDASTSQQSAFMQIEDLMKSKTRSPAKSPSHGVLSRLASGRKPGLSDVAIAIDDNECVSPPTPPRGAILRNFKQGVSAERGTRFQRQEKAKSRALGPSARINEHTANSSSTAANVTPKEVLELSPRRNFRRTANGSQNDDAISEDELAMDLAKPKAQKHSPSKVTQPQNEGVIGAQASDQPLMFARTFGYECRLEDQSDDAPHRLVLRSQDKKRWWVLQYDAEKSSYTHGMLVDLDHVNRIVTDEILRVRLEGPRSHDGHTYIFDLRFVDRRHCKSFLDRCQPSLPKKYIIWEDERMERQQRTPLKERTDKPSMLEHLKLAQRERSPEPSSSTTIIQTLYGQPARKHAKSQNEQGKTGDKTEIMTRLTRPVRATRASAPTYDVDEKQSIEEVERYSIVTGLGTPWKRQLTYGEGRHRATVYFNDLSRLDEGEWLNDSLINFYMIYLFEQHGVPKDKVLFFNTYLYEQLTSNTDRGINYKAVERWTSRVDIFSYDYLVIPINESNHWYLAIICNMGNIDRKPTFEGLLDDDASIDLGQHEQCAGDHAAKASEQSKNTPAQPHSESYEEVVDVESGKIEDFSSSVNVIDPEDTGPAISAAQNPLSSNTLSHEDSQRAPTKPHDASIVELASTTVLSNLQASASKKKNSKRRSNVQKRDPNLPVVIILDSLGLTRSGAVRALKDWVAAEGRTKRGMEAVIKEKGLYPKYSQIPNQENAVDCGVYILGYVDKFFQAPDTFKHKLLTGEMSAENDWPELQPKSMRSNLRDIIFRLADEQKLAAPKTKTKTKQTTPLASKDSSSSSSHNMVPSTHNEVPSTGDMRIDEPESSMTAQKPVLKESSSLDGKSPGEHPSVRLGSPFEPKLRSDTTVRAVSSQVVVKVLDSPEGSPNSSITPVRYWGPEVRIPARSPLSPMVPLVYPSEDSVQAIERPRSQNKRTRVEDQPMQALGSPKKRSRVEAHQTEERRRYTRLSPAKTRVNVGDMDDPIEIESQEKTNESFSVQPEATDFDGEGTQSIKSPRTIHGTLDRVVDIVSTSPTPSELGKQGLNGAGAMSHHVDADSVGEHNSTRIDGPDDIVETAESQDTVLRSPGPQDVEMQEADAVIEETPELRRSSPLLQETN